MRKLATVRLISKIEPIKNADRIQLATVDGWKCVIKAGEFAVGDAVIYCEIDSFLPMRPEFEFLRKSSFKRMGEREGFRLRTVKLRGQISQGLLLPISTVGRKVAVGDEVTEDLGIVKFEPPIPACLTGEVIGGFPGFIEKTEEERIQNLASDFESYGDKEFFVSEKLDGTSMTVFWNDSLGVCGRNWEYSESHLNSYWQQSVKLGLQEKLKALGRRIALQGELIGPGIQGNRYGVAEQQWRLFNAFDIDTSAYLQKDGFVDICEELDLLTAPFMECRAVPESIDELLKLAEGKSVLNNKTEREGLVWVHGSGRDRISFKVISNRFLAKE